MHILCVTFDTNYVFGFAISALKDNRLNFRRLTVKFAWNLFTTKPFNHFRFNGSLLMTSYPRKLFLDDGAKNHRKRACMNVAKKKKKEIKTLITRSSFKST